MADQEARFRASVAAMATTSQHPRRTTTRPPAGHDVRQHHRLGSGACQQVRRWAAERVAAVAPALDVAGAGLHRRRRPCGRGGSRRTARLGGATGRRASGDLAPRRRRARGPPWRAGHGHGRGRRQDGGRGRPGGLRGDRLRPLLRRPGARARTVRSACRHRRGPVHAHRDDAGDAAVELPRRDPDRWSARRARRRIGRRPQARTVGSRMRRGRGGRGASGARPRRCASRHPPGGSHRRG